MHISHILVGVSSHAVWGVLTHSAGKMAGWHTLLLGITGATDQYKSWTVQSDKAEPYQDVCGAVDPRAPHVHLPRATPRAACPPYSTGSTEGSMSSCS
mmetsp:Transcript_3044/g.5237  ORF Transcript_3044/g.5237 Transcript_3044/m.5237 type:complete len:98 (+) Transcript_3044:744-1037(+)